ncbi:alpha-E domain-containing protein [Sneathiella glossodoripedis]|uniref:alpha-E domain-containing protein n=1 Tax=Sneathiella glossodoripedis TaxID=418853 RepID=UPI00046F5C8D|nr:alpha-E domain-containing protein [Sneathiella glossodoripedis]
MKNSLLARFAKNTFWLARYMERADSLARLLEVTETHSRDEHGDQDWKLILEVNGDLDHFRQEYGKVTAVDVVKFYTIDLNNATSLASSVAYARENARSLRHLISTEMWSQINVMHSRFRDVKNKDIQPRRLAGFCSTIKESCQAHTGITEATLYRDQAYLFYWIGKMVERADQASRLLDVGFRRALKLAHSDDNAGESLSHWTGLLRSVGGYQAYRRTHPIRLRAREVTGFVLTNKSFPRSVMYCLQEAHDDVSKLINEHGVETAHPALQELEVALSQLQNADIQQLVNSDLHEFADTLQQQLITFTQRLAEGCFGLDKQD